MKRLLLLSLGVLFCAALLGAQEDRATLALGTSTVAEGQRFELFVKIPDSGLYEPQAALPGLGLFYNLLGGPEVFSNVDLDDKGRRVRFKYLRYTLRANQAGYRVIPPFEVRLGGQVFRSDEFLLAIGRADNPQAVPPQLVWTYPEGTLYEGQGILVGLQVRFLKKIVFPESVELSKPQGGLFEEVNELGRIESETVAGTEFQRVPMATYLLTPSKNGSFRLPPARVKIDGFLLQSETATLSIQSLPEPVESTGALGDIHYQALLQKNEVGLDEQFLLTIRVEGEGNLHFLRIPAPDIKEFTVLGTSENSRLFPTDRGYRGFRELVYRLSPVSPGSRSIPIPGFISMDFNGNFKTQAPSVQTVRVLNSRSADLNGREEKRVTVLGSSDLPRYGFVSLYRGPWYGLFSGLGVALLILGIVLRLRPLASLSVLRLDVLVFSLFLLIGSGAFLSGDLTEEWSENFGKKLDEAAEHFGRKDYSTAQLTYLKLLKEFPDNPVLWFNVAQVSRERNLGAYSLYSLLQAVKASPENESIFAEYRRLESEMGLDRQIKLFSLPSKNLLGASLLLLIYTFGFLFLNVRRLRGFSFLFATILFGLCLSALLVLMSIDTRQASAKIAIVGETGGALRKVPDSDADEWLVLTKGTSVQPSVRSEGFYLVETSFGIKGWIDRNRIYFEDDP